MEDKIFYKKVRQLSREIMCLVSKEQGNVILSSLSEILLIVFSKIDEKITDEKIIEAFDDYMKILKGILIKELHEQSRCK